MASLTLYHNPHCGTCKTATPMLEAEAARKGIELKKVEFLHHPLTDPQIEHILAFLGAKDHNKPDAEREQIMQNFLRKDAPKVKSVNEVLEVLRNDPGLMQRPIVVNWAKEQAMICRPAELVLEMTKDL
ncbi:hypothetical protein BGZ51_001726 [Haplosporangium sp. Z 767]|nr:hypothetical protein BGZ50_003363 [Haplosporangium sp. Z 11]KAF9186870.1 hypothetical protein BGZ51_001726 [Haplosporangium sp. Z 767]